MAFKDSFTFGTIVFDDFSSLYDSDKIQFVFDPKRKDLTEDDLLNLGVLGDMFYWKYSNYGLDIGFYGTDQDILQILLIKCEDWKDQETGVKAWDNPIKSVICKTKDDVTKAVTEMLEYVRKQTGVEKK